MDRVTGHRWYPSKVDGWLAFLIAIAPIGALSAVIGAFITGEGLAIAFAGALLIAFIYAGLVFPMRYGISDDAIIVCHGMVRQRIPLADITEVRPSRNLLAAPALSLDRLHITFGRGVAGFALISPVDQRGFLAELVDRAQLLRQGDRLVRAAPAPEPS